MSRHSKNNNTRGFFTYEERQQLNYGTQKKRIGRDSILNIFDCWICLNPLRNPTSCSQGHLSCKECLLESIMSQKNRNKMLIQEYEKSIKEHVQDVTNDNLGFISTQKSILVKENKSKEGNQDKKSSFWVPTETPESTETKLKKPEDKILCFAKEPHSVSLKKTWKVVFQDEKTRVNGKSCWTCAKSLGNSSKITFIKNCGHAYCSECISLLEGVCSMCNEGFKERDLVQVVSQGTGFMSAGAVVVEKVSEAFQ